MTDRGRDERGSSLIMVIVFVTTFSIITAAILDLAGTGFRSSTTISELRHEQHAVEGALDGAINAIRGMTSAAPASCFRLDATSSGPAQHPTVHVDCAQGPSGGIYHDVPSFAVITLGTAPGEGINKDSNDPLTIAGGFFSHGRVQIDGGAKSEIIVFGDAYARGSCSPIGRLNPTGKKKCNFTSSDPDWAAVSAAAADPALPRAVDGLAGLPVDPTPACTMGNNVVKFVPGVYTEHLQHLVPGACSGADLWWLSPSGPASAGAPAGTGCPTGLGVYYFDFEENSVWVNDNSNARIVAGSLPTCTNGAPTTLPSWPGACLENAPGVQLIFGGTSRMQVRDGNASQDGKLAVCAGPGGTGPTSQRIAIYGVPSGSRSAVPPEVREAAAWDAPATTFNDPDLARSIGGGAAWANFVGGVTTMSATLKLTELADIPLGSRINSAVLEVHHAVSSPKVGIGVTWQRGSTTTTCTTPATGCDITAALNGATPRYKYRNFNDISAVTLTATATGLAPAVPPVCTNGTCTGGSPAEEARIDVDAVVLRVSYTPPGFQALHSCPAATSGCALLTSSNNPVTIIKGTVYAPTAKLDISVHNKTTSDFARGIIVRTLDIDVSPSSKQEDAPFWVPPGTPSRVVVLTARIGSTPKLRARVRFVDHEPSAGGLYPGYRAEVLNWAVLR